MTAMSDLGTIDATNADEYVCQCDNDVCSWGFHRVLPDGTILDLDPAGATPAQEAAWGETPLLVCGKCGAVVNQNDRPADAPYEAPGTLLPILRIMPICKRCGNHPDPAIPCPSFEGRHVVHPER